MKITNPRYLVGKQVFDCNGNTIGTIDKAWRSWDEKHPGWFFGIRPYENVRDAWFRGTTKLVPIYSGYIKGVSESVTLNKSMDQLALLWNKAVPCGVTTWPTDDLIERAVYDKEYSRVGVFFSWVETDNGYQYYGCFIDPYLCDVWKLPHNTLFPLPPDSIHLLKDTITLNRSLDELKKIWQKHSSVKQPRRKSKAGRKKTVKKKKPQKPKNQTTKKQSKKQLKSRTRKKAKKTK